MNPKLKMPKKPLRAPLAYFDTSLSMESRNEETEVLTENQSEDELEDEPEDSWNTQDFAEHKRRQKNFKLYKVPFH